MKYLRHLLLILALLLLLPIGIFAGWQSYMHTAGPLEEPVVVWIKPGTSVEGIVDQLEADKVIRFRLAFMMASWAANRMESLKAGEYAFEPYVAPSEVLNTLQEGRSIERKVTIPEGWSLEQIKAFLVEHPLLRGTFPADVKEGDLLPETYFFQRDETLEALVERMRKAHNEVLQELWEGRQENLPFTTPEEAVILASVIEKETGVASERPHVAGVFVNRLRRGMPLQSDPTALYAITKGRYDLDRPMTRADLKHESAYNTYLHTGLPKGPIANPGRESIAAALQPAGTNSLYFVADGKGGHVFAETLEEHNRNVVAYRKALKEARIKRSTVEGEPKN